MAAKQSTGTLTPRSQTTICEAIPESRFHLAAFGIVETKLNAQSMTKAELIGLDYGMNQVLWTKYFVDAQGYGIDMTTIYQNNKNKILLAKIGKFSSTKKHINIRYCFVTDVLKRFPSEINIQHCPTEDMLADISTKPYKMHSGAR